jgi:hypothetical protein
MISGGVAARVARTQQPGQPFPARDLWPVQKRQQRVETFSELNDHGVPVSGPVP